MIQQTDGKKSVQRFITKQDFIEGYSRGKYDHVDATAQMNINAAKPLDVLMVEIKTGSGLRLLKAEKVTEEKFIELTLASN